MSSPEEPVSKKRRLEALAESSTDAMLKKSLDVAELRRLLLHVSQAEGVPASILDHLVDAFGPRESTPFAALTGDVEQIQARLGVVINGELRLQEKFAPDAAPGALVEMLALYKRVFVQTKEAGACVLVNPVLATALRKVERVFVFTEHQMESAPLPTTKLHVHGFLDHLSARPFKGSEVGNPGSRPRVPFFCTVEAKSIVVGIATHMEQLFAEMLSMVQANAGSDPSKSPSGYVFGALTDGTSYRFYAVQVDKPGEFYRSRVFSIETELPLILHILENVMQGLLPPAFEVTVSAD